jgi:ATP-dependent DNA helicase RecQ
VAALADAAGRSRRRTEAVVGRLEDEGLARVAPDGGVLLAEQPDRDVAALASALVEAQERRRRVERSRVDMVRGYAETGGCRRAFLLGYFGEPFEPPCDGCDRCLEARASRPARGATVAPAGAIAAIEVSQRVVHAHFGPGVVTAVDDERVTIAFDRVGYRMLSGRAVLEDGVLVPEPA